MSSIFYIILKDYSCKVCKVCKVCKEFENLLACEV